MKLRSFWPALSAAIVLVASTPSAHAAQYEFRKVADLNSGIGSIVVQSPAINDRGSVLFQTDRPRMQGAFLYQQGTLHEVFAETPFTNDEFRITGLQHLNQLDQVTFDGIQDSTRQVFRWSDGTLTSLYRSVSSSMVGFSSVTGEPVINNLGTVYFVGSGWASNGIFQGNATPPELLVSSAMFNDLRDVLANSNGDLAYYTSVGHGSVGTETLFLQRDGITHAIASSVLGTRRDWFPLALNEQGELLYSHRPASGPLEFWLTDGATSERVLDALEMFAGGLGTPAMNDLGQFAYLGYPTAGVAGNSSLVFETDPISGRVIGIGDLLFGGRVRNLGFGVQGLNNHGDLAFAAEIEDPLTGNFINSGIYVAVLVPEPTSRVLLMIAAAGLMLPAICRRRQRA